MSISIYDKDYFRNTSGALNLVSLFLLRCIIVFITMYQCFYYDASLFYYDVSLFFLRCIIVFITMYPCFYYDVSFILTSEDNHLRTYIHTWYWYDPDFFCVILFSFKTFHQDLPFSGFLFSVFLFVCLFLFLFYLKQMIAYVSRAMVVSQSIAIYMVAQMETKLFLQN